MIIRETAPIFSALSDSNVREWLRIDPSVDQASLDMLIGSAVDYIELQTGLVVLAADYGFWTKPGEWEICISARPINGIGVSSFRDSDILELAPDVLASTPDDNLTYDFSTDLSTIKLNYKDACWDRGVYVSYNAGFTDSSSIPLSLKHAIAVLVSAGYNGREDIDERTFKTVQRLCAPHRRYFL